MQKKDKQKVLDEVWTEDRIKSFLDLQAPEGVNEDFHILYSAYKSMRFEDFEIFLNFFSEAGKDFTSKNKDGCSLAELLSSHKHARPYIDSINKYL